MSNSNWEQYLENILEYDFKHVLGSYNRQWQKLTNELSSDAIQRKTWLEFLHS